MSDKKLEPKEFLEIEARMDEDIDHPDNCGHCGHQIIMAQTAREFLARKEYDIGACLKETRRRWMESKYFKAYQEAQKLGKDPQTHFNDLGLGEL